MRWELELKNGEPVRLEAESLTVENARLRFWRDGVVVMEIGSSEVFRILALDRHLVHPPMKHARPIDAVRETHPNAYVHWTDEEDAQLLAALRQGKGVGAIAVAHGRETGAIRTRIRRLLAGAAPEDAT